MRQPAHIAVTQPNGTATLSESFQHKGQNVHFEPLKLAGAFLISPEPIEDERGFFARSFCQDEFAAHGLETRITQCNISFNTHRHTLRGMHYQASPHGEVKVVRCTQGAIFDVIVDLRQDSPTRLEWFGVELSAGNRKMLYIPTGFAHGFQTLTPDAEVFYQMSTLYVPESARGIPWDDVDIGIDWPQADQRIVSDRDQAFTPVADGYDI